MNLVACVVSAQHIAAWILLGLAYNIYITKQKEKNSTSEQLNYNNLL